MTRQAHRRGVFSRRPRRGVALVVVLWTIALLATVTAVASSGSRTSASIARNVRAQATARALAESGILAASVLIDDSLRVLANDAAARDNFLSRLEPITGPSVTLVQDTLGDGVFAVTVVDVSARLDVNLAGVDGLTRLFSFAGSPATARVMAERIDAAARGVGETVTDARLQARDSLAAVLLGREDGPLRRRPFETLDQLRDIAGLDLALLTRAAPWLTVDGDGKINRRAASREVRAAASGSLTDAPSRVLLISRGWEIGHPLSRQIEAVYDVSESGLRLVRWREREL